MLVFRVFDAIFYFVAIDDLFILGVVVGFLMHAAGTWLPKSFPLYLLSKVSFADIFCLY